MDRRKQRVLFLMTPDRRHLVVELDEPYSRRELAVLLAAFRSRLLSEEPEAARLKATARGYARSTAKSNGGVDQIVGPGFVIELLGRKSERKDKSRR